MAGRTGTFVYGIVPADVEPTEDAVGVGDPPGEVTAVVHGELAALVSEVELEQPLGRPVDLTVYQELLDATAAVAPVVPVRFGTVVTGPDAVHDLLDAHRDRFRTALEEFEGRTQYTVRGRFQEAELIGAVLAENPAAAQLAEQVRGRPEAASREQRIRLGEIISQAVELRREAETRELVDVLGPVTVTSTVRPPGHELDALHVAFLVDADRVDEFVSVAEEFAGQRRELVRMRLLGPLAPYDFVDAHHLAG
ncbi:GvpL/GvpF family gas vesicle protein [Micromonospora sagamiensis]|uniref:Gas vesicle protein GvpL/GvpF n=1 Tax=Micromonospora sagamiensis TaxID=47875 RepID=A0A562W9E3_9ACTN|nr:GvpL/GvpF family gas vesicle protein [Micromonospora sagamiensis]TWJ26826.1 gas vesicle protein GvpL/GvpF [Micromonospora sagamiensis]BCL14287.1 gas vesicle protein [Micromonospora sagamiensis]